jgi:glycerophosphoryl diester phosphodiesterase
LGLLLDMKRFNLLVVAACFLSFTAGAQQKHLLSFNDTKALQDFLDAKKGTYPLISVHRGGPMKGFPENAIETFDNATSYQPVIVEFDVALSKDSALVIMHDDKLDRTTTGTGPIGNYTYQELQGFRLKDDEGNLTDFKIPTLNEVLTWGKGKVLFTIDIKKGVPFQKIIDEVRKTKSESNSIIITYNANQAAEVHQLAPDLMISASVRGKEDLARLNKMGVPNNRIVAFVGVSAPDKAVYKYLHSKGISCILGTMGNLDKSAAANPAKQVYYNLVAEGADILSSDEVLLSGRELDQYRADKKISTKYLKTK